MSGFIQLITAGHEQTFFNQNAEIDFFHIIYRRHTNFFVTAVVQYNDDIKNDEETMINFIIPNDGDLLSETYIILESEENYYELFNDNYNNANSYNTLNTNILNFYNNYYIKIYEYSKNDITDINIIKINISNYLTIQDTNIINIKNIETYINIIKRTTTLVLESNDVFYNLDLIYYYYSFLTDIIPKNIKNTEYLNILFLNINYKELLYVRLDIPSLNISLKIIGNYTLYENIFNIFINNQNTNNDDRLQINKFDLYFYTTNNIIYDKIFLNIENIFKEYINYEYFRNKYEKPNTYNILKTELLNKIFLKNTNPYNYHIIYTNDNKITTYNFDNLNNNDFNSSIIQQQNNIINLSNLNTNYLCTNTFLRLYSYIIGNDSININDYINNLEYIRKNNITNAFYLNTKYKNINDLYNKIINILLSDNVYLSNKKILRSIIYQNISQENNLNTFINKKISKYSSIINNKYIFQNILFSLNISTTPTNDISIAIMNKLLLLNNLDFTFNNNNEAYIELLENYSYNNNIFNTNIDINNKKLLNIFISKNRNNVFYYYLYAFSYYYLITKSINCIENIYNRKSNIIYTPYGKNTELIKTFGFSIFPLSSNLFVEDYYTIFNIELSDYIYKVNFIIYADYKNKNILYSQIFNIDLLTKEDFLNINKIIITALLSQIIIYYEKSKIIPNLLSLNDINYLSTYIENDNSSKLIYGINYNEIIFKNIYNTINKELFNNSFQNINIYKFYYNVGSPLYKLFYLFNFLCTMTIDKKLLNIMPEDLTTLRNLLLYYILLYFNLNTNDDFVNEFRNLNYNDNFLCYDDINVNDRTIYDKINIYSSFYFIKTNNNNFDTNSKYNFDDLFIIDFEKYILNYQYYFKDIESINKIISTYFNKTNLNYENLVYELNNIIINPIQYENINDLHYDLKVFSTNKLYNTEYTVSFGTGIIFDYINLLNINTINGLFTLINSSFSTIADANEVNTVLSFNINKNENFTTINNLSEPLNYFISLFYNLNSSIYLETSYYYNNLLSGYTKYLKDYDVYLKQYIINYNIFLDCQNIIISYYNTYNDKNKTNIYFYDGNYIVYTYQIILNNIFYYFNTFLYCDVVFFIEKFYNTYDNFESYLLNKYGSNIYLNLIYDILKTISNETSISLNFAYINIEDKHKSNYIMFYEQFNSSLINIKNQYDIFIYPNINNSLLDKNTTITISNNNSISYNYDDYKKLIYMDSLKILKAIYDMNIEIYIQNSKIYKNTFVVNIIKQLFLILNNFYENSNDICYFKTIYYKNYLKTKNTGDLLKYTTDYINYQILESFSFETELNRFLYFHTTRYAIKLNGNNPVEYLKLNSLYDIVRMYKNPKYIEYQENLNISQNNKAYELLNFNLYNDKYTPLQNSIFVELTISISDYYKEYVLFYNKCMEYDNKLFNSLKISENENAGEYFLNIDNVEYLNEYINDYILLNKNFSPFHIYHDILKFKKTKYNISVRYEIQNKEICKKIVIYLFNIFIISKYLPEYIIKYLDLRDQEYLQYKFPLQYIDFKIEKALNNSVIYDLEKFIYTYYYNKLNLEIPIKYKKEYNNEQIIIIITKNLNYLNVVNNYYNFCTDYINSYSLIIGYENYNIDKLSSPTTLNNNFSYSDIIKNINLIYNLDQDNENISKYDLTNYTLNFEKIYYENNIYNINNITENDSLSNSKYLNNMKEYRYKSDSSNINVFLTLPNFLLNFYNIDFVNKYKYNNNIITNLLSQTNYINELQEILKGNTNNYTIYNDLIVDTDNQISLSRSLTIRKLSVMVSNFDYYGLSLITPIDYDNDTIFNDLKKIYNTKIDIFKKFYNIKYNFYQYYENYKGIYARKLEYYNTLLTDNFALLNIKKNNTKLYQELFVNIFYTNIAQTYYLNSATYIEIFKINLKLYIKYNYIFRNNKNLNIEQNIDIQSSLSKQANNLIKSNDTTLKDISNYIGELYYYELFDEYILNVNKQNIKYDFIEFFNDLGSPTNYYFQYYKYGYNYINKIKLSIEYINNKSKHNILYNLNKEKINDENLNNIINFDYEKLYSKLIDKNNIWDFFNNMYNKHLNDSPQLYDYYKFIQTINIFEFLNNFKNSVKELIKYDITLSINYQLDYTYNLYFKNKIFYYKTYIQNSVQYSSYILDFEQYEYYVYNYITYIIQNDNNLIINKTFYGINEIIYDDIINNDSLNIQIELINNYFIKSNNIETTDNDVDDKNGYLVILLKLNILLNMAIYQNNYKINMDKLLNFCNTYIITNIKINCIDLKNDISLYFDYLNKNIINNNVIPNYFKNVMNITEEKIFINNIEKSKNNYEDNIVLDIYTILVDKDVEYSEKNITLNILPSVLSTILSKNTDIINYDNPEIVKIFIDIILNQFKIRLNKLKPFIGGNIKINTNYAITVNQMYDIYSKNIIEINGEYGNCFSLIYINFENFNENSLNNYLIINLIYYNAMLVYLFNYGQYFLINLSEIILYLTNLINLSIINNDTIFFNELNKLLKNQLNNDEYIKLCKKFFDNILFDKKLLNVNNYEKTKWDFSLKTYIDNEIIKNNKLYYNNNIINKYIINSKINIWISMTPLIYDSNNTNIINYMKSISIDNYDIINVPELYLNYTSVLKKIINEWGILQIFEKLSLFIGQQIIDYFKVDNYKIYYEIMTDSNKVKTIKNMYGMDQDNLTDTLVPYIKKINKKIYYIPVYFFFKDRMNALPLIACLYPTIILQLITNKNNLISKFYSNQVLFKDRIKFKTSLSSDFILLEREERKRISMGINDNLIEKHNNYKMDLSLSEFNTNNNKNFLDFSYEFSLNNSVKELFWTLKIFINDYELTNIKISDFVVSTIFLIDRIKTDGIIPVSSVYVSKTENLDIIEKANFEPINRYINTYKYNTRSNPDSIYNSYSYSFDPEAFQPTGAFNMSNCYKYGIIVVLDYQKLLNYIGGYKNLKQMSIQMDLFTYEYNILRFQSGIAGLLFQQ